MYESALLRSHEYDSAFNDYVRRAVEEEVAQDPLLQQTSSRTTNHSGRLRYVFKETWDQVPVKFETIYTCTSEDTRKANFAGFHLMVRALGERYRVHRGRTRAQTLEEVVKRSGQNFPGNPALTWENLLNILAGITWKFDKDGEPLKFDIEAGLGAYQNLAMSARPLDFDERMMELVERKRKEWDAKKRSRRLSR